MGCPTLGLYMALKYLYEFKYFKRQRLDDMCAHKVCTKRERQQEEEDTDRHVDLAVGATKYPEAVHLSSRPLLPLHNS